LNPREVRRTAVVLLTSDRGLCGSYNSEVLKKFVAFEKEQCACNQKSCGEFVGNCDVITIGKKGAEFTKRYKTGKLIAEFPGFENNIQAEDVMPISKMTSDEYLAGKYDRVVVIYSHFESSLKQIPVVKQILPISNDHIDKPEIWTQTDEAETEYKFEPSPDDVLEGILKQFLRVQIYGAILEANASEHSARMVAMKNATDSAGDLIDELKLVYNAVRQGSITREIAEISGAAEAMK
jgi:F-type H+-transporting ATPase subunit gamma